MIYSESYVSVVFLEPPSHYFHIVKKLLRTNTQQIDLLSTQDESLFKFTYENDIVIKVQR